MCHVLCEAACTLVVSVGLALEIHAGAARKAWMTGESTVMTDGACLVSLRQSLASRWHLDATKLSSDGCGSQGREDGDGFRRFDVLYRLCDLGGRPRQGARTAGVRVGLGARALAHSNFAQDAVSG